MRDYSQLSEQELTVECHKRFSTPHQTWVGTNLDRMRALPLPDGCYWQMLDELPDEIAIHVYHYSSMGVRNQPRSKVFQRNLMIAFLQYKDTKKAKQ